MANTDIMAGGVNKMVAMVAGAVLVLVGILGFVPGQEAILGLFEVNLLHNLVHLLSGAALLGAAFIQNGVHARMTLLVLGVVYALVAVLGFVAPDLTHSLLGSTAVDVGLLYDNILHVLLAVVFIAVPLVTKEETRRPMGASKI